MDYPGILNSTRQLNAGLGLALLPPSRIGSGSCPRDIQVLSNSICHCSRLIRVWGYLGPSIGIIKLVVE